MQIQSTTTKLKIKKETFESAKKNDRTHITTTTEKESHGCMHYALDV